MGSRWLLVLGLAGCLEPDLVVCADGRACAVGLVCDNEHHLCLDDEQLAACEGAADGASCMTSQITGLCFDGVCLVPGCGNGLMEPGEQCDDGNFKSGDGCSVDCSSTEVCANGIVDLGEACDDGNRVSHDGCDSKCQTETVTWRAYPILYEINSPMGQVLAFDPQRHRLVYPTTRSVWEWDGTSWTIKLGSAGVQMWTAVVYEPVRQRVIGIGRNASMPQRPIVAEWDGSTWTELTQLGVPPMDINLLVTAYDGARGAIAIGAMPSALLYLTIANGNATWSAPTTTPFQFTPQVRIAFDVARQRLVVVDPTGPTTWELSGTTWSSTATAPPGDNAWTLVFDGARNALVALGGYLSSSGPLANVSTWTGSAWLDAGATIPARHSSVAWYDPTSMSIGFAGGIGFTSNPTREIYELAGTVVTDRTPVLPGLVSQPVFYDHARSALIAYDNLGAAWSWDGTWQRATTLADRPTGARAVYDPVRGGAVMLDLGAQDAWVFHADWDALAIDWPLNFFPSVYEYDYASRGIVAVGSMGTYRLGSTGTTWTSAGPGILAASSSGYDISTDTVVVQATSPDVNLLDLVGGQWQASLSAGSSYIIAGALHTGSILILPMVASNQQRPVWQRRAGEFTQLGLFPFDGVDSTTTVELPNGRLLLLARDGNASMLVEYQSTSALPDESCTAGEDVDTDGLAGCADPDCWMSCGPACPLATSCP